MTDHHDARAAIERPAVRSLRPHERHAYATMLALSDAGRACVRVERAAPFLRDLWPRDTPDPDETALLWLQHKGMAAPCALHAACVEVVTPAWAESAHLFADIAAGGRLLGGESA